MKCACIKQSELPHATRLFTDFLYQFERVQSFYSFRPFNEQSFDQSAQSLSFSAELRSAVAAVLEEQMEGFGPSEESRRNLARFRNGAAALVTGQQVGLFTGPAFSFYKALTTVRLADWLTGRGVDCVPIFWLATEDHDLEEVNHAFLLDGHYQLHRVADSGTPHPTNAPVGEVALSAEMGRQTEQVIGMLPDTAWKAELARALQETYRPGETFSRAFGGLMARLLGRFGVLLLDPMHPRLHQIAAGLFRRAVEDAGDLNAALLSRDKELVKAGYHAQVHVTEQSTLLFQRVQGQRIPVRRHNGAFLVGEEARTAAQLLARLDQHPEEFSPNVLLRPVLQDYLLPTVAYVGGPSELAYLAQASVLYQRLLGRMPVVYPRASFTVLDARAAELLARYQAAVPDVLAGPQSLREKMAEQFLPPDLAAAFERNERRLQELLADLHQRVDAFDHTLADALATSGSKMSYQLTKIKRKAALAAGRRSAQMESDAALLENLIHPNKSLQERVYTGISFLGWFGPALLDRVYQKIAFRAVDHQVLSL